MMTVFIRGQDTHTQELQGVTLPLPPPPPPLPLKHTHTQYWNQIIQIKTEPFSLPEEISIPVNEE